MKYCEVLKLNVQPDHVRLVAIIPPKASISSLMGVLRARGKLGFLTSFRISEKVVGKSFFGYEAIL